MAANQTQVIYAKDATPLGIADAFARQSAQTQHGLYGPIGASPMIIIPASRAVATLPARRGLPALSPPPRSAAQPSALQKIRAHHRSVGGYACVFNVPMVLSRQSPGRSARLERSTIKRGAFLAAIAKSGWFLLRDHQTAADHGAQSFASMGRQTLHVEEDSYGLWFEAQLSDDKMGFELMELARRHALSGVSIGSSGDCVETPSANGYMVIQRIPVWELSLLKPGSQPGCAQTWCLPNREAHARRHRDRFAA
jgi:HK97 family phage prohead protease